MSNNFQAFPFAGADQDECQSSGGMEFTAKVEKDATVIGTGLSQYMTIKDVD